MRNAKRCPKCQNQKFWTFPRAEITYQVHGHQNAAPLNLNARSVQGATPTALASLEVWVCAQCGYTEWYTDPKSLSAVVANLGWQSLNGVYWVDGSAG